MNAMPPLAGSALTALRLALHANGFRPVPISSPDAAGKSAGKRPLLLNWREVCAHADEAAIRSWSRRDEAVDAVQQRVDAERERATTDAYLAAGVPPDVASLLGRIGVGLLIGMQHRSRPADGESLEAMYRLLHELVVAQYLTEGASARRSDV